MCFQPHCAPELAHPRGLSVQRTENDHRRLRCAGRRPAFKAFQVLAHLRIATRQIGHHMIGVGRIPMADLQRNGRAAHQDRAPHFALQAGSRQQQGVPVSLGVRVGGQS